MTLPITVIETNQPTVPESDDGFGALATSKGNLPLEALDLAFSTTGLAVSTELTQRFTNPYAEPLEANYIFPLPPRAALTSMRMEADNRVVEGILRERERARADYDQAVAEGKRASIAEEERPGVFTMRVGNILPGEQVAVRLTLAGRLGYEDGQATLRFPLVVAPRYIPGRALPDDSDGGPVGSGTTPDTDAVPDASRITPPVLVPGFPNPVRLSVVADIDPAGLPLTAVASSLHPIDTSQDDAGRLHVRVHPGERVDRDFVLRLRIGADDAITSSLVVVPDPPDAADSAAPTVSAARNDTDAIDLSTPESPTEQGESGDGTFVLTLLPPHCRADTPPRDVVFVLDRSGSMSGWKMVAARRATARIVDTLTSRDRLAVLAFDNTIETPGDLPDGLVDATDRHRFRAVEHLARMEARGGTELLAPLAKALELLAAGSAEPARTAEPVEPGEPVDPGRERVVVLVTDGQVGNEDQILRDLAPRLSGVRLHTIGIDVAVNRAFLERLAALGGGHTELVESEDRLDAAMAAIHRRIGLPVLTDVRLEAHDLELLADSIAPARLPDLYAGSASVVTGRYRGGDPARGSISVRGLVGGTEHLESIPAWTAESPALAAIWARTRLRDLEDEYVTLQTDRWGAEHEGGDLDTLERRIVQTSLRFGVLCRFTAYVAIDTRVVTDRGTPRKVTQPVELPQGWELGRDGTPGFLQSSAGTMRFAMAAPPGAVDGGFAPQGIVPPVRRMRKSHRPGAGTPRFGGPRVGGPRVGGPSGPGSETAPDTGGTPSEAQRRAAELLAELASSDPARRPDVLAGLGARLDALIADFQASKGDPLELRPLRDVRAELDRFERSGPMPAYAVERLWLRILDVLRGLAGPAYATNPQGPDPRGRSTFWRRRA